MPRTKDTRNPVGTILGPKTIIKDGKKIQVYDVRKRYADINEDGQRVWRNKTQRCYSYSEALVALGNMPGRIENERQHKRSALPSSPHTLAELIKYYKTEYLKPAVVIHDRQISGYRQRTATIKTYLDDYEHFFGSNVLVTNVTYEDLRRYREHLATTPVKYGERTKLPEISTVNRKLAYLRRIFNIAKRLRWIDHNPFQEGPGLINAKAESQRERILTFEEEQRLLAACSTDDTVKYTRKAVDIKYKRRGKWIRFTRPEQIIEYNQDNQRVHLRLPVLLAIDCGLRKKEIFSLERRDVLLDDHLIDLPAPKTKALRRRLIVLSPRVEDELRQYFKKYAFHPNAPIFFGQKDCDKAFATACRNAHLEDLTFHDLRHTATSWMDEAGIGLILRKKMIGHEDDRTHGRYHNMSADIVASIQAKMSAFENSKKEKQNGTY